MADQDDRQPYFTVLYFEVIGTNQATDTDS